MALRPHIIHVVGYSEANHAASAEEAIESAIMAAEVASTALRGNPDLTADPAVRRRKDQLIEETGRLIDAIRALGPDEGDPLSSPAALARAVALGYLDAPQLVNNAYAPGRVRTRAIDGALWPVDERGNPLDERRRLAALA